jgi:opacity protein-like surface antigen
MKKLYCLLLAAVLVLTAAGAAMAEDAKQGPEIYVDYGLGGTFQFNMGNSQMKKTSFGQMSIGAEYHLSRWNFGAEYAWANDFSVEPNYSTSVAIEGDSTLTFLKAGYQVMDAKQIQLSIDGLYARNSTTLKAAGLSNWKFDTNGLLIGPEVCYAFNDALKLQGFYGYGVAVSQKLAVSGGNYDLNDESMTLFNLKLTYSLIEHWAASLGYRAKEIQASYGSAKYTDKQDMVTLGAVYRF